MQSMGVCLPRTNNDGGRGKEISRFLIFLRLMLLIGIMISFAVLYINTYLGIYIQYIPLDWLIYIGIRGTHALSLDTRSSEGETPCK